MMESKRPPAPLEIAQSHVEQINGNFKGVDILTAEQFDTKSLDIIFNLIPLMKDISKNARDARFLGGTITALLFYEASTRTKLSFDTGTKQLGGQTTTEYTPSLSESKGESFNNTIKTVEAYCDAIVLRHPDVNSVRIAAEVAKTVPIINAGNGNDQHPTQMLGDLPTILNRKNRLSGLRGLLARDILNSRTAHSFLDAMALYPDNIVYILAQKELQISKEQSKKLRDKGLEIIEIEDESDIPRDLDYWYINRVQKARLEHPERDFERLDQHYVVDSNFIDKHGNDKLIILHAQPIGKEIPENIQEHPQMVIDDQVRYCQYARMALNALILGKIDLNK